ncbi:hypothetical protein Syun_000272 [Stephania yunnanensis]|uniref:NF-X1-type domain-containing protein n=1 Tax=Stephania yunnanensis TaxID=152371 RepID=A0AAP0LBM3_9MAGN
MASADLHTSHSSDSDTDPDESNPSDFENTIFKPYIQITGNSSPDLSKIKSFLTSSKSGALSCLICLDRIRSSDPTWSCHSSCYAVFHLFCIQTWARQASDIAADRAAARLSRELFPAAAAKALDSACWNCPKCRVEYSKTLIPKIYFCFCGKVENPISDPWVLPHSCGEVCGRGLRHNCGHECLLLCHPGPCPSCPKLVKARCFCGAVEDVRRCGFKNYSCNGVCSKVLDCGVHYCLETCHEGACPPCRAKGVYRCQCAGVEEERQCFEREFRCENPCERLLGCGKHVCDRGCHSGSCGACPLQGKRSCPCGKRNYEGVACDVVVPTCGATCGKMLSCNIHRCPERCHRGACIETCRTVILKSCKCGTLKKEVPCFQALTCERKCQRMRDCGRHSCRHRCCNGDCPPCSEICGRKLRCNNHKCPSPCHRGPCAPCPLMVTISCSCGETSFEVPCGTEVDKKPPKCPKPCGVSQLCKHNLISKPHKCHYGACPSCRLPCEEEFQCGHKCKLRCHGPKPAAKLEFMLKPTKRKLNRQLESTPGSPCPPCQELVWRPCLGHHVGTERVMLCSNRTSFSCENLCGNLLDCSNHYCTKHCHALKSNTMIPSQLVRSESCEECDLPCQKERKVACPHPCPLPCHPGDCPPCKVLIKRSCHCGSMIHVFDCAYFTSLPEKEQLSVRSCAGPCHRKLPNCSHLCPEICHPGPCPLPDKCSKKVNVRCECQSLKKEWLCQDVQAAYRNTGRDPKDISKIQFGIGLLPCISSCSKKPKVADSELQLRKTKAFETKEVEADKNVSRRRKRRERVQEPTQASKLQIIITVVRRWTIFLSIVVFIIVAAFYCYKGLFWLSDWMNEVEERKQMRRVRGI